MILSASSAGAGHTQVIDYHPTHMTVVKTVSGSCWEGSIAANRSDAFRCMTGNEISDPCFVRSATSVACPDIPTADSGLLIKLTTPLPQNHVSGAETPWAMSVASNIRCRVGTGTVIPGFPYYCSSSLVCAVPSLDKQSSEYFTECGVGEASSSGPRVPSRKHYAVTVLWR
ncbi:MAG TPA: hypothetical protein VIX35_01740 [Vicinamibacterales bacterium]